AAEHDSGGIDTVRAGCTAEVAHHRIAATDEPQHRAGRGLEDAHPDSEDTGRDLVAGIEATEDDRVLRQAACGPRGNIGGRFTQPIADLVAIRQMDDTL